MKAFFNSLAELLAFFTLIAVAVLFWAATPAHAFIYHGETGQTCYEQSDGHGGSYYACD